MLLMEMRVTTYCQPRFPTKKYYSNPNMQPLAIRSITTLNKPTSFLSPIPLRVLFTTTHPLSSPLEWRVVYVGSANSEQFDQTLESFETGATEQTGNMEFEIECKPPNPHLIPRSELVSVTALLITASYKGQEAVRVGYYIHNTAHSKEGKEISELEMRHMTVDEIVQKMRRVIIANKPRLTAFKVDIKEPMKAESDWEGGDTQTAMGSVKGNQKQALKKVKRTHRQIRKLPQRVN